MSGAATLNPIPEPHFPSPLHLFVWRNWELANFDRMAAVVGSSPAALNQMGRSMGLPPKPQLTPDQLKRIYISVIRENWHLLPKDQLRALLGWTREKLAFTLKEDDFLDIKLGPKPDCKPITWKSPSTEERRRSAEIRKLVERTFGKDLAIPGEPAFAFVHTLSSTEYRPMRDARASAADQIDISGWAVRGESSVDPRLVERVARYLRDAMGSTPGKGRGVVLLRNQMSGAATEGSSVEVNSDQVVLSGTGAGSLLQSVHWMQREMELHGGPFLNKGTIQRNAVLDPRYLYSYFAVYGDPLLETDIDPFPDGYLEKLAQAGINGVWLQGVLNTLAPSKIFSEFGHRSDERLATLSSLAQRAARSGVKILLYLNEPRAMPAGFFANRPELRGAVSRDLYSLCTSQPAVREWISESLSHVFRRVPELGGVFSITMSENLTNCHSKFHPETCPRCSHRPAHDVVGEVLEAIRSGVRASSKTAEVIQYDWGWPDEMCRNLIPTLGRDTRLLSVSEWESPIDRGGIKTAVGEYSISVVGPGPRAARNWKMAKEAGIRTIAKTQFNNTWEISAVPYIPVANLIARHCENLVKAGVSGMMASWTLGGYPSPNLEIASEFYFSPHPSSEQILRRVAERRYGRAAAPFVLEAWDGFSKAFELYPYSVAIYVIPTQHGPANLLRAKPTGVNASMILFPQDDYHRWIGKYSQEVAQREFSRMADLWESAVAPFRKALQSVPPAKLDRAREDLAIAETCSIHFRSTANQLEFYRFRDSPRTPAGIERMRQLLRDEIELARRLYPLARRHSVIAYEASNHYYYRPANLMEKVVSCQYLLDREVAGISR